MTLRRILSAVFVPLFLFMAVVFPMEKSYATGSLDLVPDPSILEEKVGKQTVSGPCAAYCLAYAKTLITPNTPHQYTEYYINRECKWYKGNYTNYDPEYRYLAYNQQNKLKVLKKAYEELSAGRLPIVYVTLYYKNSGERYPHWALVVGYKNVNPNDLNSLTEGNFIVIEPNETSVYKGYKQDKIEMRGDRAEMSDFPLYLNTVAGGLDRRDQTIGGFSFVVKIYALPVVEIIG